MKLVDKLARNITSELRERNAECLPLRFVSFLTPILSSGARRRGIRRDESFACCERRRFIPLLSKSLLDEYRAVLSDPALTPRFPQLTPQVVEVTLRRLRFVSDYVRVTKVSFGIPA